jgi:hypothetical protein
MPCLLGSGPDTGRHMAVVVRRRVRVQLDEALQKALLPRAPRELAQRHVSQLLTSMKTAGRGPSHRALWNGLWRPIIFDRDNYVCYYCYRSGEEGVSIGPFGRLALRLQLDHINPRTDGGPDYHLSNIRTACRRRPPARLPGEFRYRGAQEVRTHPASAWTRASHPRAAPSRETDCRRVRRCRRWSRCWGDSGLQRRGASRWRRATAKVLAVVPSGNTLTATLRRSRGSRAAYTSPIPPAPSNPCTSYGPRHVPGFSVMERDIMDRQSVSNRTPVLLRFLIKLPSVNATGRWREWGRRMGRLS